MTSARGGASFASVLHPPLDFAIGELRARPSDRAAEPTLVERAEETAVLRQVLQELLTGVSSLAMVSGEPGAGRSALLRWAVNKAEVLGLHVVTAAATCAERDLPLALARRLCGALDGDSGEPDQLPGSRAAHLPGPDTAQASFRLCRSVVHAAGRRPVLVVVDDLHWADQESQRWLQMLVRRGYEAPIAVLAASNTTHRSSQGGTLWPAVGREIRLRPLSHQGIATVLRAAFDVPRDAVFVNEAARATRGNPAVLVSALQSFLRSEGAPGQDPVERFAFCAAQARGEQVLSVLDGLPDDLLDLVRAVAVCHDDLGIDLDLVLATAGASSVSSTAAVDRLLATGLVSGRDCLRMLDDTSTERVLASMDTPERHRLCTSAALLGYRRAVPEESLARMLLGAPVIGRPWVVEVLRGVAATQAAKGHLELATRLLGRALREPVSAAHRASLLVELARARLPGSPEGSDRLLQQVVTCTDRGAATQGLLAADLLLARGDVHTAQVAIASAVAKQGPTHPDVATLIALHRLGDDLPYGVSDAPALRVPELPDLPITPAEAGVVAWRIALRGNDAARTRNLARRALDPDVPAGGLLMPRIAASMALLLTEDVQESAVGLHAVLADARRWRTPMAAAVLALVSSATLNVRCGNLDSAQRDLRAAVVELPPRCLPASVRRSFVGLNAVLQLERGDVEKAERVAFSCGGVAPEVSVESAVLLYARGMVRLSTGDSRAAAHLLLACGRLLLNKQWTNPAWLPWRSAAARALAECGEADEAISLVTEERRLAVAWGVPGQLGITDLAAAAVANGSLTSDAETKVVGDLRPTPFRLRYAEALIDLALAKYRCGEKAGAASLLGEARVLARASGARGLAERADDLLGHVDDLDGLVVGGEVNSPTPGLTGVELRVMDLVCSGLSKARIGLALSVDRQTVELHLTRAHTKLGPSSPALLRLLITGTEGEC